MRNPEQIRKFSGVKVGREKISTKMEAICPSLDGSPSQHSARGPGLITWLGGLGRLVLLERLSWLGRFGLLERLG